MLKLTDHPPTAILKKELELITKKIIRKAFRKNYQLLERWPVDRIESIYSLMYYSGGFFFREMLFQLNKNIFLLN